MSEDGEVCLTDGATVTDLAKSGIVHLYAKWVPTVYSILYELYGGELPPERSNPTKYTIKDVPFTLVNPVKAGYGFSGWSGTEIFMDPLMEVRIDSSEDRFYSAN